MSSGSACTSASLEPSYVLRALGAEDDMAHSSIRFGIGRFTTEEEIDFVVNTVKGIVEFLRELSPLWEMGSTLVTTALVRNIVVGLSIVTRAELRTGMDLCALHCQDIHYIYS